MSGSFAFLGPNGNLKAQSSQNIELGVDYTRDLHGGKFSSRLAWFQKDGKDTLDSEIVDSAVTPVFVGFMGPGALTQNFRQAVNRDETVIKGWEATCRYDTTKWYANASFSAISGENVKSGDKLNTIPGDKVTLECGYFVNDDITLGARGLWVSSRRGFNMEVRRTS